MRFFTPELYLRVNSRDEDVADQAAEEWDAAIEAYRNNLDSLKLPEDVRLLTSMCLHDADWIPSRAHVRQTAIPRVASISVQQGDSAHVLVYLLVAPPTKWQAQDWPFSKDRVHWLYDEIDASRSEQRGHY